MTLHRDRFADFFGALNDGHRPFTWQTRLLDFVLQTGTWPTSIQAPTGAGKSNVVDVHVFLNALSAVGRGPRVPRRMSVVAPRRGLVDQHQVRAERIEKALGAESGGILAEVREALLSLTTHSEPFVCVSLRGGVSVNREWIDDPTVCAVIAATPDMFGSRMLFRGYGATRRAAPREAGLLGLDNVVVIDEAHLNRQLQLTAERVATMVCRDAAAVGVPGLSVVGTTATPAGAQDVGTTVGVEESDLLGPAADPLLVRRLVTPKPVRYVVSDHWSAKNLVKATYLEELATEAEALAERVGRETSHDPAPTVLCVVNRVDTAARLAARLRRSCEDPDGVQLWVGRMRPMDLDRARVDHPGLFTTDGDDRVRFLVATQTVEVGVDIDCAALVTELAPGSALGQRFGRVNRLGLRHDAEIVVVGPVADQLADSPPYDLASLHMAYEWVQLLAAAEGGAAPWRLTEPVLRPPEATLNRWFLSHIQPGDTFLLAETSQPLFAEPDLTFWLRDSLEDDDQPIGVVVRELPTEEPSARALLAATPVDAREQFPCSRREARAVLATVGVATEPERRRAFRVRENEVLTLDAHDDAPDLKGGDVLVVDRGHPLTMAGVVVREGGEIEDLHLGWGPEGVRVLFADVESDHEVIDELVDAFGDAESEEENDDPRPSEGLIGWQVTFPPPALWEEGTRPPWVVLTPEALVAEDPDCRQEWSPSDGRVLLSRHARAVAERASRMGRVLGVADTLVTALALAGELHDEGKRDRRFQREVLGGDGRTMLAKSGAASAQARQRKRRRSSLPRGWRHEQLSVAHAVAGPGEEPRPDIALRLIGTSHGHGRSLFPHGAGGLGHSSHSDDLVQNTRKLFASGGEWSRIIERTHRDFGLWGCAYLEAILRSADCAVSKEGS